MAIIGEKFKGLSKGSGIYLSMNPKNGSVKFDTNLANEEYGLILIQLIMIRIKINNSYTSKANFTAFKNAK